MKKRLFLLLVLLVLLTGCAGANKEDSGERTLACTLLIECETALQSSDLDGAVRAVLPESGVILEQSVAFAEGESVFDVLQRACRDAGVAMEFSDTPVYHSAYIEGIGHLYEFDCGSGSGWMYSVNGEYPNFGCSRYTLKDGDAVAWRYTCDYGADLGHPGGQALDE